MNAESETVETPRLVHNIGLNMNRPEKTSSNGIPKILVVCDRKDTAPIWGYIIRQEGLVVILKTSVEMAIHSWSAETPDLMVIDIDITHHEHIELYRKFREVSVAPVLLFLPGHHETQILDAYAAGVDEVVVKPISPPIFIAKILAWVRRSWASPVKGLSRIEVSKYQLDPIRECLCDSNGLDINLTNLEFRLLQLLMSQPAHIFSLEEILEYVWGGYGNGDQVMLKNVIYRLRRKIEADPHNPVLLRTDPRGYFIQG